MRLGSGFALCAAVVLAGCGHGLGGFGDGGFACPEGQARCGDDCVVTRFDPENCGACGQVCDGGVCQGGTCMALCPAGSTLCEESCVDLDSSAQNCGGCGQACAAGQVCRNGACAPSCARGEKLCGDDCADLWSDPIHCGDCDNACGVGGRCENGACVCAEGLTECSGLCTDTDKDTANCGGCGQSCSWGEVCHWGHCILKCPEDLSRCGDDCVDFDNDPENCGDCGVECGAGAACVEGSCVPICAVPDAGAFDAGAPDAGPEDAGLQDAGPPDAGTEDAGPTDAGPEDAGPRDAGSEPPNACNLDTQACFDALSNAGAVVDDIFHDTSGKDATQIPHGVLFNNWPACADRVDFAGCAGRDVSPLDCPGEYVCAADAGDGGPVNTYENAAPRVSGVDHTWWQPCRLADAGLAPTGDGGALCPNFDPSNCIADGTGGNYLPWEGLVFDLGGLSNKVALFASNDQGPQPCESLEYTVFLSANPYATGVILDVGDGGGLDTNQWIRARLVKVYDEGWFETRAPDPAGHGPSCGDTATYSVETDSFAQVFALPAGLSLRYAAVVAGNDGRDFAACAYHSNDGELDGVAGLDALGNGLSSTMGRLVINEVDYDNIGTDTAEFIEVENIGSAPAVLAGVHLMLVNGGDDSVYSDINLDRDGGAVLLPGQFLVAGASGVVQQVQASDAGALTIDLGAGGNLIQNGSPDGVALVDTVNTRLLDALSYEGSITAAQLPGFNSPQNLVEGTPTSAQDSNTAQGSLCRNPDGQDTDNADADWTFCKTPTPGAANQ